MNQRMGQSFLVLAAAMALSGTAHAEALRIRIHALQAPSQDGGDLQVMAMDGLVYGLPPQELAMRAQLEAAIRSQAPVDLQIASDGVRVAGVVEVPQQEMATYTDEMLEAQMAQVAQSSGDPEVLKLLFPMPANYQPSILSSRARAQDLFDTMFRGTAPHSQCFQRAQYWTHALALYQGIKSMKVFMFFSEAYRTLDPSKPEEYLRLGYRPARDGAPDHRWWFHVAPLVYVQAAGESEPTEMVLDPGFGVIDGPLEMREWTDVFVDTHKQCQVMDNYRVWQADHDEYGRNPDRYKRPSSLRTREHCWLRIVPMYIYTPQEIEFHDARGTLPNKWSRYSLDNMECAVRRCAIL